VANELDAQQAPTRSRDFLDGPLDAPLIRQSASGPSILGSRTAPLCRRTSACGLASLLFQLRQCRGLTLRHRSRARRPPMSSPRPSTRNYIPATGAPRGAIRALQSRPGPGRLSPDSGRIFFGALRRVETATLYRLTDLGRSLDEPLAALDAWTASHWHQVEAARQHWNERSE
jgi:hypothetical protein